MEKKKNGRGTGFFQPQIICAVWYFVLFEIAPIEQQQQQKTPNKKYYSVTVQLLYALTLYMLSVSILWRCIMYYMVDVE